MGFFDLFKAKENGLYLVFICLKCNAISESKIHADTLALFKASIKEPTQCSCGNRTQFKYNGVKIIQ